MDSVRRPAVAGTFYRGDPRALRAEIEDCFTHQLGPGAIPTVDPEGPGRILGLVCPHAALQYSGPAAAWSYRELARDGAPDAIIVVGPNHTGMGQAVAVSAAAAWNTPLGDVPVAADLRAGVLAAFPGAREDDSAHRFEHSLEVQLPFIQYFFGRDVPVLPIALRKVSESAEQSAEALRLTRLAQALADATQGRRVVIIASNDMTHFEPQHAAAEKDRAVIEKVLALDAPGMLRAVDARRISMCGVLAVATMLRAAVTLGAREASLLTYYSSGDIIGDKSNVVGYAAVRVAAEAA
jgi:AmmeMemoRadiSam system protein B